MKNRFSRDEKYVGLNQDWRDISGILLDTMVKSIGVCIILFISFACSGEMKYMKRYSHDLSRTEIPELFTQSSISDFNSLAINTLINDPISLKIDTTYQLEDKEIYLIDSTAIEDIVLVHIIEAYDLYQGKTHRMWFLWESQWMEKTTYKLKYFENENGVFYSLTVTTYEAPTEDYVKWRLTSPSKKTKEQLIVSNLE